jgi:uncharacterized protein YndB with AHSA1/START domain
MAVSSQTAKLTLPTDEQILIVREFDAPKHLVFRAFTEPELVRRWWHTGRGEMTVCEIDLRVGGAWRYAMVTPEGQEVAFHGEYREIVPDERIVHTEIYEAMPGEGIVNIVTFSETDGRTTVEMLMECGSQAVRDGIIDSGMETGLQDALDLLEQAAVSLR